MKQMDCPARAGRLAEKGIRGEMQKKLHEGAKWKD